MSTSLCRLALQAFAVLLVGTGLTAQLPAQQFQDFYHQPPPLIGTDPIGIVDPSLLNLYQLQQLQNRTQLPSYYGYYGYPYRMSRLYGGYPYPYRLRSPWLDPYRRPDITINNFYFTDPNLMLGGFPLGDLGIAGVPSAYPGGPLGFGGTGGFPSFGGSSLTGFGPGTRLIGGVPAGGVSSSGFGLTGFGGASPGVPLGG